MSRNLTLLATFVAALAAASAQANQILQESFESPPGAGYTLNTAFDDSFDYFDRYAVPDNSNAARDDFQNGWDGQFGIQGQDHDGPMGPGPTVSVDVAAVASNAPAHIITLALGAVNSEPNFDNFEAADGDSIEIFAVLDGGSPTLIGAFHPPAMGGAGGVGAGDLYLDTDGDSVGDGTKLTIDLADFSFPAGAAAVDVGVRIEATSTSSFESWALDNVRINAVPEPNSIAMLAVAGVLLGLRRIIRG